MANHQRKLDGMLYEAVRDGDFKRVLKLVRAGANVNQVVDHGWTPVGRAALSKNREVCEILLQNGADPNLGEQAQQGAYSCVCGRDSNSVAIVRLLVEHGIEPNLLIHPAASSGTVGMVRQLLKRGADPNLLNFMGHRPLRDARSPAIIRELLKGGADPLAYSADNEHPLHYQAVWGHTRNVKALLAAGVPPDYPEHGPPDQPHIGDGFALHMAVSFRRYRCAKALLTAGANPELLSSYHTRTPLMVAASRGFARLVKLLLRHRADPGRCIDGVTARSAALDGLEQKPERARSYQTILAMLPGRQ